MRPHWVLILIALLLIIPGATAYTQLATVTVTGDGTTGVLANYAGTSQMEFGLTNGDIFYDNVTRITAHFNNITAYSNIVNSGNYTGSLKNPAGTITYGSYNASWEFDTASTPKTLDLDITLAWTSSPGSDAIVKTWGMYTQIMTSGGSITSASTSDHITTWEVSNPDRDMLAPFIQNSGLHVLEGVYTSYSGDETDPLTPDFICTPTSGPISLLGNCVDNSTGHADTWNWSYSGPGSLYFDATTSSTTNYLIPTTAGNYTVRLDVSNDHGSANITKTDYIWAYNSTSTATLYITAINANSANPIIGANIDLYDVENASWTNTTSSTTGTGSITTLLGHTVNAYASATGFADNDKLAIPVSTMFDSILMFPSGWTNVTSGNATLFVYTYDSLNHALPISGAAITVASATTSDGKYTNSAGMAQFTIKNETPYLIDVRATGYSGATQMTTYTGVGGGSATQTVTFYLSKKTVTPTVTMTTGPGGTVPTTVDPYDDMSPTEKQNYLVSMILDYGPMLVLLFIMATIMGTMKMMGK